jgi:lipopolysaccharide transport system permease protein
MNNPLVELLSFRGLLWAWMQREVRVRYKQAALGIGWAIVQPFSLMVIFTVIFGYIIKVPTGGIPYPIFSFCALLPWTFFASSISFGSNSLVNNMNLVTKIYFPREILPLASIGAAFLDYLIGFGVFILFMLFYQARFYPTLLLLPILLIIQIALTIGVGLILSALTVFYRDIRFVVPLLLQVWMYLCPIVYPIDLVPPKFLSLYMLNPMASLIDSYRRITLLGQLPQWNYLALGTAVSLIILIIGYTFFRRVESKFADLI